MLAAIGARQFGLDLPPEGLAEAFSTLTIELNHLKDLGEYVLSGLFARAADLGFIEVPADLVLRYLGDGRGAGGFNERSLERLIRNHDGMLQRTWKCCLERFRAGDEAIVFTACWRIVEWAGDRLLSHIRLEISASPAEKRFIEGTLRAIFNNGGDRTPDRLAKFRAVAPSVVDESWLPVPISAPAIVDSHGANRSILEALGVDRGAVERTWLVLGVLRKLIPTEGDGQTVKSMERVIAQLPESTRRFC